MCESERSRIGSLVPVETCQKLVSTGIELLWRCWQSSDFQKGFYFWQFCCRKFHLTTTLCWRANAPRTTMMAARERAVRRRRRKRRRGGEEGEGGGEGGDGDDDPGEEPQKVCSVITLSSSPYWCLLPILGRKPNIHWRLILRKLRYLVFSLENICSFQCKKWKPESVLGARLKTLNPCRHFNLRVGLFWKDSNCNSSDYLPFFNFS